MSYHQIMQRASLYLTLVIATIAVSWAAIFIRLADADPISTAFYRMAFAVLLVLIPAIKGFRAQWIKLSGREKMFMLASGIALGLHFATWITSLKYTSISNSVIIVATQPFFVAIVEHFWWGDKINKRTILGMALAFAGMVIISVSDFQLGGDHLFGDLLALAGAFLAGIYLLLGRRVRQTIDNRRYVLPVYAIAAGTLLLISFFSASPLTGFTPKVWLLFFLLALIPTIMGHTLYNYLLKYIKAHLVAVTILGEPIGATIFGAIIFHEYPAVATYVGGGLILIGIFLALSRVKSHS